VIETDVDLEKELEEFEGAFERDEVMEFEVLDLKNYYNLHFFVIFEL
jgi:hypothetical protein